MSIREVTGEVLGQKEIAKGIFDLRVHAPEVAGSARPGQFVNLYCRDLSRLLPRPISICQAEGEEIRFVYRMAGEGTKEFSTLMRGDSLRMVGPLGNGFPETDQKAIMIGGGIGIPPLYFLAKQRQNPSDLAVLGYRDDAMFLLKEFGRTCDCRVATEDGSFGFHGNVVGLLRKEKIKADVIFSCGPLPMLRALKEYAQEEKIRLYVSLEERMACGVGACLGCVCRTTEPDEHSGVRYARVCKEGPVFDAEDVNL